MGVEIYMSQVLTVLGFTGMILFGITALLNYKLVKRLKEDRETTIEMFFLRSEIKDSMKNLLLAVLVFGVSATVSMIGLQIENIVLAQGIRVGSAVLFVAYMMFFYTLYESTRVDRE